MQPPSYAVRPTRRIVPPVWIHLTLTIHFSLPQVLPSDMRDRLHELEYGLSLRDALFPAPEIPGHLQYLAPDAWAKVTELKAALTEVEILIGAAAHCIYSVTGPSRPPTFSDRDFAIEMASFARFYSSFKVSEWMIAKGLNNKVLSPAPILPFTLHTLERSSLTLPIRVTC